MFKPSVRAVILTAAFVANNKCCLAFQGSGAGFSTQSGIQITSKNVPRLLIHTSTSSHTLRSRTLTSLRAWGDDNDEQLKRDEEESRLKILESRRKTIRSTLRGAESLKYYRMENDYVPEIDEETGKPIKSDSKLAITLSAFVVAAGAVTLRVGGRAALVSGLGLDFANGNPELKENMDQFLTYASSLGDGTEALLFLLAWTVVKVFCFDAGGIVLALSAGILFGGVLQGALFSAFAATFGSSVAYFLAKMDTPIRKKALEIVEEYPSLRGIEKVVAEDGLKAVLTLRLAPILPVIPIGAYNYVYGVTNVPYFDFAGGIFLGSLKPYLLDSYLGYFGKELIDGTAADANDLQDLILLVVLGVSVLIGVFASQLAGETWESVAEEVEAEKLKKKLEAQNGEGGEVDDGITRSLFGFEFPEWAIGAQIALKQADVRMEKMIQTEYKAAVWNCTDDNPPPFTKDPSKFNESPEVLGAWRGFDAVAAICDGFVLSPSLIKAYFKYGDPLYDISKDDDIIEDFNPRTFESVNKLETKVETPEKNKIPEPLSIQTVSEESILQSLRFVRENVIVRLEKIEKDLKNM